MGCVGGRAFFGGENLKKFPNFGGLGASSAPRGCEDSSPGSPCRGGRAGVETLELASGFPSLSISLGQGQRFKPNHG